MEVSGKFSLTIHGSSVTQGYSCAWTKRSKQQAFPCTIDDNVVSQIVYFAWNQGWLKGFQVKGHTYCKMELLGRMELFLFEDNYRGGKSWFDWCLVECQCDEGLETHAAMILSMFKIVTSGVVVKDLCEDAAEEPSYYTVVQLSKGPVSMSNMERDFISPFSLGDDYDSDFKVVTLGSIIHPLAVFKNYGGHSEEHFCILPKRKWSRYFGDKI